MGTLRPFQLPQDIDLMVALVTEGFQYPENPDWNVQADEREGMADQISGIKRIWPLLRIMRVFVPLLHDVMRGFIYEEDGKPVGLINHMRQRSAPEWHISNVTVLPACRRRGIARKLVEAALAEIRARQAQAAYLEVVTGNLPAYKLYEELGFVSYTSTTQYDLEDGPAIPSMPLPAGFDLLPIGPFDWKRRMAFALRITPPEILRYEPIRKDRFRPPFFVRILGPLISQISGVKSKQFVAVTTQGETVAMGGYQYRTRPGGVNHLELNLDPAHPELAEPLARQALSAIQKASPDRRIEIHTRDWQPAVSQAFEALGCKKRLSMYKMGLIFK
ncbi:MAG: GNAT family N-acetyltransferase [Chloroflexota bacterium]